MVWYRVATRLHCNSERWVVVGGKPGLYLCFVVEDLAADAIIWYGEVVAVGLQCTPT